MVMISIMVDDKVSCYYSSVYKYDGGFIEYMISSSVNWGANRTTYRTFDHDEFIKMFDKHENKCGFEL